MVTALMTANILDGPLLFSVYGIAAILFGWLVVLSARRARSLPVWMIGVAISALVGVVVGLVLSWLVGDVWSTFGQPLSTVTTAWGCAALAATGVAVYSLARARWRSRLLSIIVIPAVLLAGAMGINADVAEFPTVAGIFAGDQLTALAPQHLEASQGPTTSTEPLWKTWKAPPGLPATGQLGTETIPATVSKFPARPAVVYLPPAALAAKPPKLPVVIVLSGQPGKPYDVFLAGGLQVWLDAFAAAHHGLAPIVVAPDQLSDSAKNPMCVDSPLGNSATYVTVDVPNWINDHLNVIQDRAAWAIAGFSEGGTCSIQLGAAHPTLFGHILDVSGELKPHTGSVENTIAVAFGGSADAYAKAWPINILKANTPYSDTTAIFVIGENDAKYRPGQVAVSDAAKAAGMTVTFVEAPGTGHDWHTAAYGFTHGMNLLCTRFGLSL